MYFKNIPVAFQNLFKGCTFNLKNKDSLYLTFDDGPHPDSTPYILDKLKSLDVKATFFCLGQNANKHPYLLKTIRERNHTIGNHSYHHYSGWSTPFKKYIKDIEDSDLILQTNLFRPPYGRLTVRQYNYLKNKYQIILWDNMPGDFSFKKKTVNTKNLGLKVRDGSIIVLHDNPSCLSHTLNIIEYIVDIYKNDYAFVAIQNDYSSFISETKK